MILHTGNRTLAHNGSRVQLAPAWARILAAVAYEAPDLCPTPVIYDALWQSRHRPARFRETLRQHMHALRLAVAPLGLEIINERGAGYRLSEPLRIRAGRLAA